MYWVLIEAYIKLYKQSRTGHQIELLSDRLESRMARKRKEEEPAEEGERTEVVEEQVVTETPTTEPMVAPHGGDLVTTGETKLNKYGFIHIPKQLIASLPFQPEEKLRIYVGQEGVSIRKAL